MHPVRLLVSDLDPQHENDLLLQDALDFLYGGLADLDQSASLLTYLSRKNEGRKEERRYGGSTDLYYSLFDMALCYTNPPTRIFCCLCESTHMLVSIFTRV